MTVHQSHGPGDTQPEELNQLIGAAVAAAQPAVRHAAPAVVGRNTETGGRPRRIGCPATGSAGRC